MADDTRDKMIDGATRLLAQRGLHATSINDVLELTGTPRGSVYHHFPGGKRELVGEAISKLGRDVAAHIEASEPSTPEGVFDRFVQLWRWLLKRPGFELGCGVVAVAVEAGDDELAEVAAGAFATWREALGRGFVAGGFDDNRARSAAVIVVAAIEGAVVLARSERSIEPFDVMVDHLRASLFT